MTNDTQAYIYPPVGQHKLESEIERLEAENAELVGILTRVFDWGLARPNKSAVSMRKVSAIYADIKGVLGMLDGDA